MTENEFIELAVRYLDGATSRADVNRLGAAMLDSPERRATYRDLAHLAQLAHEWRTTSVAAPETAPTPISLFDRRPATLAAVAAAIVLVGVLLLRPIGPPQDPAAAGKQPEPAQPGADPLPDYFKTNPSWSDIYRSPFDTPDFVWRAEFSGSEPDSRPIDEFSGGDGAPPFLAATISSEFNRLLAPIVLLPAGENFGSRLY